MFVTSNLYTYIIYLYTRNFIHASQVNTLGIGCKSQENGHRWERLEILAQGLGSLVEKGCGEERKL